MTPPNTLRSLYFEMLRLRKVEESIAEKYAEQEMRCPVHLSIGQEAVPAAVSSLLTHRDYAMSGHRSHAHYLAKGGSLKKMLAEIYGKDTGCSRGKGGSMHLIDLSVGFVGATPIVGSTIPIAVGTALSSQMNKEDRVTVIYLGDGSTEEGVFHESVNFAVLKKLPVLFVCENNFFSVYSDISVRQPRERQIFEMARGHGIPSLQADGNDIMQVRTAIADGIARARRAEGPSFFEFITYRWREHCGPNYDNDIGYRTEADFQAWKKRCPLARFESELRAQNELNDEQIAAMNKTIDAEIAEAFTYAKESPFPDRAEIKTFIYAGER
jgi:TPP-dependent pyruvate/acetoin dehydrogenase alpha subunit